MVRRSPRTHQVGDDFNLMVSLKFLIRVTGLYDKSHEVRFKGSCNYREHMFIDEFV